MHDTYFFPPENKTVLLCERRLPMPRLSYLTYRQIKLAKKFSRQDCSPVPILFSSLFSKNVLVQVSNAALKAMLFIDPECIKNIGGGHIKVHKGESKCVFREG